MKSEGAWKHFAIAAILATILYVVLFQFIERRRGAKGAWEIEFHSALNSPVHILIRQRNLGIEAVRLTFPDYPGTTNLVERFTFDQAKPFPHPVSFGTCVFADLTFLPGTVVIEVAQHSIELMPAKLIVDSVPLPWSSGTNVTVPARTTNSTSRPKPE